MTLTAPMQEADAEGISWPEILLEAEGGDWSALGDPALLAARACAAAFAAAEVSPEGRAVSILLTDDAAVADLNRAHRGREGPTNVLSWPAHDLAPGAPGARPPAPPAPMLLPGETAEEIGDLALAAGVCAAEAAAARIPLADHVTHLLLHGTLHCLGYDHISDPDAVLMERLETEAMQAMGLQDPYRDRED